MNAAGTYYSASMDETSEHLTDTSLLSIKQHLYDSAYMIVNHTDAVLAHAQYQAYWQDFIVDLKEIINSANQLSALITKSFAEDNLPLSDTDLAKICQALANPINNIIGTCVTLTKELEQIEAENAFIKHLQKVFDVAQQMSQVIKNLNNIDPTQSTPAIDNGTTSPAQNKYQGESELLSMEGKLQTPTQSVIEHVQTLLNYATDDTDWEEFIPDLEKILKSANNLSNFIKKLFNPSNYPNEEIDLDAFSSTVRHDLRTPINAMIGYSEMLLEDLEDLGGTTQDNIAHLQGILNLARRLLSLIEDLSYLTNKKESHSTTSATQTSVTSASSTQKAKNKMLSKTKETLELVDMGQDLQTPTSTIIAYTEMLLDYVRKDEECQRFSTDLNKMLASAQQLLSLIKSVFAKHNYPSGQIDTDSFSSTLRHDLRTPINAIIGFGEMLLEDFEQLSRQDICMDLQKILVAARRLLTTIDDLTYFTKPENAPDATQLAVHNGTDTSNTMMDAVVRTMNTLETQQDHQIDVLIQDALLLVVDDKESNRELLQRRLGKQGFRVEVAENGRQALNLMQKKGYDLVLLDIIMPEMDGFQVLKTVKQDRQLKHIPVIMISALDEIDGVVRCIQMGAEDYLQKPFNQVILKAKISASLERKRLRDREHAFLKKLQVEQEKSERLLLNILPKPIADRLKKGAKTIADSFEEVTVLFSDLVGFTELSTSIEPTELVEKLNEIFLAFDILAELHGLEKIKTIGDAYMLVGGLPTPRADHVEAVADIAIDMFDAIQRLNSQNNSNFNIRVGIHTGSVVAGIIGKNKFNYDLWGDAVNVASRMESHGIPGKIQVSEQAYQHIKHIFEFEQRGEIEVKGKGKMRTYFLKSRKKPKK